MSNFFIQVYSNYRGLFAWLNWQGYISTAVVYPFATVIMFVILGRFTSNPALVQTYSLGIATASMSFILIGGLTQSYTYDRMYGTISFVFASSGNRGLNFLSRSILHFPNGLLSFVIGLTTAWLVTGLDFSLVNWAGFVFAVIIISISITAFGQLLGVISIATRDWAGIQGLANGLLLILCGAIIPLSVFPRYIQEFAQLLPITNGLSAVRDSFMGAPISQISADILREAVTGLVYYIIAFYSFRFFERWVKIHGTLERDAL